MADAWIKMRKKLLTDPRVWAVSRRLEISVHAVLGGLFHLWCIADDHGGNLSALDADTMDEMVRIKGFVSALPECWIRVESDGIELPEYDEHNGSTGKRRAMEAKRKADARKPSAHDADKKRDREEKIREEKTTLPADKPPKPRKPHWSEPAGSRLAKLTGCPKSGPWSFLSKLAREQTESAVLDALARFPWDRALNWKHASGWITEAAKSIHSTAPAPDDYEDRLD